MPHVYIDEIAKHEGQTVTLRGWLYNRRSSGKLHFLEVRDGTGIIQAVLFVKDVPPETFEAAGKLPQESAIEVTGLVKKDPRSPIGYELGVSALNVVSVPTQEYPISPKEHGVAFLMDHRHLWLRSKRQHAILRIRAEIVRAVRDFFDGRGFTLVDAPIFTPSACEGTSNLFEVGYFDQKAYLTQSGQLYMEAAAMAMGKVYCFGPTFRAEKSKTRRHLTEFWMVEPEVAYLDLAGDMDLAEDFICFIVERVLERRRPELAVLERDISKLEQVKKPFPRIRYEEAIDILTKAGKPVPFGEDFGGDEETVISEQFDRPVMINRYPRAIKAFYMKTDPEDPRLALCVDVIAPEGYGEIIGGGQREDDLATLEAAITKHELPREAFEWFLDLRRYGSVPHAGFGLGIERTVSWLCGLHHVRETIPFPRMLERLTRSMSRALIERLTSAAVRAVCVAIALWFGWVLVHNHAGRALLADGTWAWLGEGGALLVVVALVAGALLARAGWPLGRAIMRPSGAAFAGAAFALALVSGVAAHYLIHKGVPEVPDEFGYLHQARTFAHGWLAAPSPPLEEFHYVSWAIHDHGAWYAVFPPAYGVLLGVGVRLGVAGLVNPLLGALLALVLFELGKELLDGDGPAARLAVVFYLCSWFRLMHAGSFMAHPTAALFTGLTVLGAVRGIFLRHDPPFARIWAITAGVSWAALLATRPLNALILAAVLLPPTVVAVARERRHGLMRLARAVVAALPVLLAYFAYNRALTGHALLAPQERYMQLKEEQGDCFRLGFGKGVGECPLTQNTHFPGGGYSVDEARKVTGKRLYSYASDLFGVAPLALLPIFGLLGGALAPAREARRRALLGLLVFATVLGYALFFYHGVVYGARFYYETLPFVALLGAALCGDLSREIEALRPGAGRGRLRRLRAAAAWALPVALIVALRAAWPGVEASAGKRARTDDGEVLRILGAPELRDAVVFVDSQVVPAAMTPDPIDLTRDRPLVVRDLGDAANAGFLRAHPGLRPLRLSGHHLLPLSYRPDAPVRHEGGAKYPLEVAVGGFGDRVSAAAVRAPPLSDDEALRFRARQPGAWFAIPIWVPPGDAGDMTVHVEAVAHAEGPAVGVSVDGKAISSWLDTRGGGSVVGFDLPATLTAGRHWLAFRIRDAAHGEARTFLLDYVELRRR